VNPASPAGRPPSVLLAAPRGTARGSAAPAALSAPSGSSVLPRPRPGLDHAPSRRIADEGPERLSTPDLLEVLLGGQPIPGQQVPGGIPSPLSERSASRDAWAVLERFESLRRIASGSVAELRAAGLSTDGAVRVAAAFALGRRAAGEGLKKGAPFVASSDIFERYLPAFRDARRERFLAILLDSKNRIMRDEWISEGSLTSSLVHPREVFARAIRESAGALVFVHNHPSGDPEPSPDDVEVTKRLCTVGEIVGIRVLDHVVIGEGAYVSFLDRGWIG
jgi:DNA repair protein RadC